MSWAIDDLVGWIAVGGTELGLALSDANAKEKAAVRTGLAVGLAVTGNSAAVGAAVTAAASLGDIVMEEMEVNAEIRQGFSAGAGALGTVMSGGASSASLVSAGAQTALYATGEAMEAAGVEGAGGQVMQGLSSAVSLNAGDAIAKTASGLAGAAVAGAIHERSGGDDEQLLAAMSAGFSTGASVGGAANSIGQGSVDVLSAKPDAELDEAVTTLAEERKSTAGWDDADRTIAQHEADIRAEIAEGKSPFRAKQAAGVQALVGEGVGAVAAAAVHAKAEEEGHGEASFLDSYSAGRALGKAATDATGATVSGDQDAQARGLADLSGASARAVKVATVDANTAYHRKLAEVHGSVGAQFVAEDLAETSTDLSGIIAQTGQVTVASIQAARLDDWLEEQRKHEAA